jgi:hypothetical protein
LLLLDNQGSTALLQMHTSFGELVQCDHLRLVRVEQPMFLTSQAIQTPGDVVLLSLIVLIALECGPTKGFELIKEPGRIFEQLTDVRPDGALQLGCLHWSA